MNFSFPYTYEIEPGKEIILTVEATYHPAERGTRTDPGFAAYVEVDSVTGSNGETYLQKLCGPLWDKILDAASDQVPDQVEPEFPGEGYTVGADFSGPFRDFTVLATFGVPIQSMYFSPVINDQA